MDTTEAKEGTAMNTTTTLTREQIVATDTRIAEINAIRSRLCHELDRIVNTMHRAAGDTRIRNDRGEFVWQMDFENTVIYQTATHSPSLYADYTATLKNLRALREERDGLVAIYAEHRWSRFFLVTNEDGHIHSSTACSTCRPTTEFAWLTDLSGQTEAEAVEAHGAILCTVCYPSAPTEWTNGESHEKAAKKAEAAQRKAEREAKKLEKALLPNGATMLLYGEEAVNGRGEYVTRKRGITTLAQAKTWLREISDLRAEGRNPADSFIGRDLCWSVDNEATVTFAIASKTGTTATAVRDEFTAKAEKKAAKYR